MKKGRLHPSYNSCIGGTQTHSLRHLPTHSHAHTHSRTQAPMVTPVCLLALLLNDISSTERTWCVGGNLILRPFLSPLTKKQFHSQLGTHIKQLAQVKLCGCACACVRMCIHSKNTLHAGHKCKPPKLLGAFLVTF